MVKTEKTDLSFIPVLATVFLGVSLTLLLLTCLRFKGVKTLIAKPVNKEVARKVLHQVHTTIYTPYIHL